MFKKHMKWIMLLLCVALLVAPLTTVMAQDEGEDAHSEEVTEGEGAVVEEAEEEESSVSPLVPLGINQGFLIAQIFNFLLIFGILTVFLWRPLMNMLDSRSQTIAKGVEDAAAAANARRNAEAEADKILAQARSEAAQVVDEGRVRGEEVAKQIEAEARTEADRIREEARVSAQGERDAELAGLRDQVSAIGIAVANRLLGENLDAKKQQALINDFFAKVPADAKSLSGEVEVVSAMPLSDDEKSRVKSELGVGTVTFVVNPSILGGLLIRAGDRVVDGTVRSNLSDLASSLR